MDNNSRKQCSSCHEYKPLNAFGKRTSRPDGLRIQCKACEKEYRQRPKTKELKQKSNKRYHQTEKWKQYRQEWAAKNKDRLRANQIKWVAQPHNRERRRKQRREQERTKRKDPLYRLGNNLSRQIRKTIHHNKQGWHWENVVGYSLDDLKAHLETQFQAGMTWKNYGSWHIDHIKPKSSFPISSQNWREITKEIWALKNLQPLWAKDNISKGSRFDTPFSV